MNKTFNTTPIADITDFQKPIADDLLLLKWAENKL